MRAARFARLAGPLLPLLLAAACGGADDLETPPPDVQPPAPAATIRLFEAQPDVLAAGSSTTLTWRTEHVASLLLTDGTGTEIPLDGAAVEAGSIELQPAVTTTYTLTGTAAPGANGPAWQSRTVTVVPPSVDAPTIESFTASASLVPVGGDVVLTWRTTNATRLTLKDDAGAEIPVGDGSIDAGQATVQPARSPTVYELVATGPGGRAEASVTVDVSGLPRITRFFVDPLAPVAAGDTVTVAWETVNTAGVTLLRDGVTVLDDSAETSGSRSMTIDDTTEFVLQAAGPGGSTTARLTALVGPRISFFTASQRIVRAGDPVVLAWMIADADRATLDGPGGFHLALAGPELESGSTTVNVGAPGDFTLTAFRGPVGREAALAIDVTAAPRVRSCPLDQPAVTAAADHPGTVVLSWVQDGADSCTVYRNNVAVPEATRFACATAGSIEVQVFGDATLRLVAENAAGSHACVVDVDGVSPARIVSFASNPDRRLTPGTEVELSWTVTDAVSIAMEKSGATFPIGATAFTGTARDRVDFDSVYTLTARNSLGYPTVAERTVRAGAPVITSASAEPAFAGIGAAVVLAWTADGGETLTVTDSSGTELFRTTEPSVIDDGSTTVLVPLVAGTYSYTVTVTNGQGVSDAAVIEVVASDGPMIDAFTSNKLQISLGESLTVSWNVTNDASGTTPTLALTDNYGHTFDISSKNPNNGSFTFTPAEEGAHVYTLTARTAVGRTVATATLPIEVTVKPMVVSFTATPDSVSTQNGSVVPQVVLAWQSQNGVEVTVWESDAAGNVIPPPLHRAALANGDAQAALDAGSITVGPTASTYYVLRVKNRVGSFVDSKVKVVVDPPEVLTFQAVPPEVIEGESVQFSWTTQHATGVRLAPLPAVVSRLGNTFFDVSVNGGTKSTLAGDTALAVINLPTGFVFPFGGTDRTQIQVSTNGWAGFNTTNTGNVSTPGALPNESYRYANFAVFTGDLDSTKGATPGELWYGKGTDAGGDFFAIQWKNWSWWSSSYNPSVLNFELVLRPNGDFEYRYGNMSANQADHATGVGSSLGFQLPTTGSPGMNVVPNSTAVPGGLANTGFAFQMNFPANGRVTAIATTSGTYTVTAFNADATASKDTSVTVWKVPSIASVSLSPSAPETSRPFRVQWTASDLTRVRVLDSAGAELCRVTDPTQLASGSCTLTEATPGVKMYTVEAINGLERNLVTKTLNFTVFPYLAVTSFTVTPGTFVHANDQVTLTWTAAGATEVQLFACTPNTGHAVCTDITPAGANPLGGTYTRTMTGSVDFWLRVYDVQYRVREASLAVWVDVATVDTFSASSPQISAGASTQLNWTTTGATTVSLSGIPIQEPVSNTATAPFIDISTSGTVATRSGTADVGTFDVPFPAGFSFPWFGTTKTGLRASTDGWVTFDMGYSTEHYSEQSFPTSSTYAAVQVAPFWDDLQQGSGPLAYQLFQPAGGPRYLVVQWKGWQFYNDTTSDLNFEVILWENGNLDFRYAAMNPASNTNTAGDSAGIGYQNPTRTVGKMLASAAGEVVPGGLANRSWRFPFALDPDGSIVVSPTESTTYRLCATNASLYPACQDVRVVVVGAGDILFSELMIAPPSDDAEWFEVRNTAVDPIDLAGWTIASGTEMYQVPATPLVVPPGGFAVFARSGDAGVNGGVAPAAVYGNVLSLANAGDDLRLYMGGAIIDSVTWGGTGWTIPATGSIALEPSAMARSASANDAGSAWCPSAAVYGAGLAGSPGTLGAGCLTADANQWYVVDPTSGTPFIDISTTGTDDSSFLASTYYTAAIPLGFTMPYFDGTANSLQISKHGYVTLAPVTATYSTNSALPSTSNPNGVVAPFWDEMYSTAGTSRLQHRVATVNGHQVMIVQWTAVSAGAATYGTLDYQLQLWDNGDIAFVYRNVNRADPAYAYLFGTSATIGIENVAGTSALQLYNGSSSTGTGPIYSGRAYRFVRR